MSIITFISDFGLRDHYVSAVKGAIYRELPDVVLVDISHQIKKYNLSEAAYVLKHAYSSFPQKTVHLIGLNTEHLDTGGYVAVEYDNHFFVAADNGVFSLLFDESPSIIIELQVEENTDLSFPVRDIFAKAACRLASGIDIKSLGKPKEELLQRLPFRATSTGDIIRGAIVFIDSYENVITNISRSLFEQTGKGQPFVIEFARGYQIDKISRDYNEVPDGELFALFNSSGFLEIAIRNGKVSSLLNLDLNTPITIHFS